MGLLAPSSCADFCAPILDSPASISQTQPLKVANSSLSRSFCSQPIPDITPSHAHSSPSLLRDRHTHYLQLRSVSCYPQIVVLFPSSKLYFLRGQTLPTTPFVSPGSTPCAHSTFPTPLLAHFPSFIAQYHLYNTVHYIKKKFCRHVQVPPGIHTRIRPLNSVVAHGSCVCGCPYLGLTCNYHHHFPAARLYHSLTNPTLCVHSFLRISLSGLSLLSVFS